MGHAENPVGDWSQKRANQLKSIPSGDSHGPNDVGERATIKSIPSGDSHGPYDAGKRATNLKSIPSGDSHGPYDSGESIETQIANTATHSGMLRGFLLCFDPHGLQEGGTGYMYRLGRNGQRVTSKEIQAAQVASMGCLYLYSRANYESFSPRTR